MDQAPQKRKLAVVLFNLGGPDSLETVQPFLYNLFNDPAIMGLPGGIRPLVARIISKVRAPTAKEIYSQVGGKSPLIETTDAQSKALEHELNQSEVLSHLGFDEVKTFVSMRYWKPLPSDCVRAIKAYDPEEVVLLPLFPHYSTTTVKTAIDAWLDEAITQHLTCRVNEICCYPEQAEFIEAHALSIEKILDEHEWKGPVRVVFSAHSLPERIVAKGDPYPKQVAASVAAIMKRLNRPDIEHVLGYQSRLGPVMWIGPSVLSLLEDAGQEGRSVIVVPIAFVSEHVETLVELDHEVRDHALEHGVPDYVRCPALGTHPTYIDCLVKLVDQATHQSQNSCGGGHDPFFNIDRRETATA